jgi:hypothetical protein
MSESRAGEPEGRVLVLGTGAAARGALEALRAAKAPPRFAPEAFEDPAACLARRGDCGSAATRPTSS